jgi:hypothetical protein
MLSRLPNTCIQGRSCVRLPFGSRFSLIAAMNSLIDELAANAIDLGGSGRALIGLSLSAAATYRTC